jgi:hypothetical protein
MNAIFFQIEISLTNDYKRTTEALFDYENDTTSDYQDIYPTRDSFEKRCDYLMYNMGKFKYRKKSIKK